MRDEIILKNELAWNCMNNKVIEFITEDLTINELFEKVLGK